MNPLLLTDFYKIHHTKMYPEGMTKLYSNFTPRKSRIPGVDKVVVFGIQHFIKEYLIKKFNKSFFHLTMRERVKDPNNYEWISCKQKEINEYKRHCNVNTDHIEALWDLGYLPIEIKALDEGTLCPIGVPCMTITNTHPDFGWLVNYLETLLSCCLWQSITSATIAYEYKKILTKYAKETDENNLEFVNWQGHDFSMRGMSSVESAILSGMGHLTSFTGTDTIPAIYQLEKSYNATGLIGASVPATEHSVMCMGTKESEIDTFKRLLKLYPEGILSVVSDTWDLWKVCTEYLPILKEQILARNGKLVIRPDSGDPVNIICGELDIQTPRPEEITPDFIDGFRNKYIKEIEKDGYCDTAFGWRVTKDSYSKVPKGAGVIELLWDVFGGTVNEQGYKVLDPHIGAIYGDSITMNRTVQICERLKAKSFASTNVVLGIGSMTYTGGEITQGEQYWVTRDLFGFAMKATYGEVELPSPIGAPEIESREIFKDPITDDGTKRSKKGLLRVLSPLEHDNLQEIYVEDQCTWEEEQTGLLKTVFKDSKLIKEISLEEIRNNLIQKG